MKQKGFTLVELIVVITIVSILSTIGFVTYVDYLKGVRDGSRAQQISEIYGAMELYATRSKLPYPDEHLSIFAGSTPIGYQGYAGEDVLSAIRFGDGGKDPKTKEFFTYFMSADRKYAQILGYFEEQNEDTSLASLSQTFAEGSYESLFPRVFGMNLGILVTTQDMKPVQQSIETFSGQTLNILSYTGSLTSYLSNTENLSGNGVNLIGIVPNLDCKRIKDFFPSLQSGIYKINPIGSSPKNVYCNMSIDGGGWTLVARSVAGTNTGDFGWLIENGEVTNDTSIYSLGSAVKDIYFDEILFASYTSAKQIDKAVKVGVDSSFIRIPATYDTAIQTVGCTEITPLTPWRSPCDNDGQDGKVGNRNFARYWGYFDETLGTALKTAYFFRHQNELFLTKGLMRDGYYGDSNDGTLASPYGELDARQGMIFVR